MVQKLVEDTDPHDQLFFNESCLETSMGPQGSAGVGFSVFQHSHSQPKGRAFLLFINN
jgi:hypothetical protein